LPRTNSIFSRGQALISEIILGLLYNKSMSVCPKCNTNIDEDFGLVDCSGCGVAVLVGIDGDVQVASSDSIGPPSLPDEASAQSQVLTGSGFSNNVAELNDEATNFNFSVDNEESGQNQEDQFSFEAKQGSSVVDEFAVGEFDSYEAESESDSAANSQAMFDEFTSVKADSAVAELSQVLSENSLEQLESDDVFEDIVEELNDEKTNFLADSEILKSKQPVAQTELVNLSEFANSKKSSLKDGYLKYKLYIGGIDTNDIKKQVFEELADKKLLLDLSELNKKIVDGNLCIEPISAVKASILINRLKSISVTIAWDQYDIRKA